MNKNFKKIFLIALVIFVGIGFVVKAEAATNVYYSVGQSNTTELMTGSPNVTVSSGVAAFTVAQTGNIGVGDRIIIGATTLYISGKVDTSHWNVVTNVGATPADISSPTAVTHIYRTFANLNAAVGDPLGATGLLGTADLTTGSGYVLNIPVYYDTGADSITSTIYIRNITTSATAYINIYTATSTISEVNQSQRHDGKWKTDAYRLESTVGALSLGVKYITLDGLQIKGTITSGTGVHIIGIGTLAAGDNKVILKNNIIRGIYSAGTDGSAIRYTSANDNLYIYNNIIYGFNGASYSAAVYSYGTTYAYNNTLYGNGRGLARDSGGAFVAKNNIAYNNTLGGDYTGTFDSHSTNNLSKDATAPNFNVVYRSKTLTFTNTTLGSEDFHLVSGDTDALNKGTDLSSDPDGYLSFNTDIDGQTRSGTWEIGADDFYVAPDTEEPTISSFVIPATATSRNISVTTFDASDNTAVTQYLITESATTPGANDAGWSAIKPTSYTITGTGTTHTLYAWAQDAAQNVSASVNASITITPTAASCSQAAVKAEIDVAQNGDVISIPACSETVWSTGIVITKAIVLQGAGIGSTNIKGNLTYSNTLGNPNFAILTYYPSAPSAAHSFRLTGMTINGDNKSQILLLYNPSSTIENIRVDHINFLSGSSYRSIYSQGSVFGVIDNNSFTNYGVSVYGSGTDQWDNMSRNYGDDKQLYIEDNAFTDAGIGSGQGGRYAARYNSFTFSNTTNIMEFHGNQPAGNVGGTPGGNLSTMITEIYGNAWNLGSGGAGNLIDQRGGKSLIFLNKLTNGVSSAMYAREEYADSLWPQGSYDQHITNAYSWSNMSTLQGLIVNQLSSENCGASSPEAWQPNYTYGGDLTCKKWTNDPNGYVWKSCPNGTCGTTVLPYNSGVVEPNWSSISPRYYIADGNIFWLNMGAGTPIIEGTNFWTQKSGVFDGTGVAGGGVGTGSLASRPATCTTGVGYWATNQSTTDLTGMVGVNPSTPISGTLYKCTAPNTWTSYYTPYTYPHPLRNELSTATGITSFDFSSPSVTGTVDNTAHTVSLTVPFGTSKTSLTPTIVLATGATISPTSGTAQNFTNPVNYTVTAEDGTTQQTYTVTVNVAANTDTNITSFDFASPATTGTVDNTAHTVALTVPFGTSKTSLTPTIVLATGATISPNTGVATDYTNPVTYTVTAQDGTTQQAYTVTVTVAPSTAKAITAFDFNALSPAVVGVVNEGAKTVSLTVPYGTAVTALVPTITITGASISPTSGVAQNFTNPVIYTVTAANASTQDYIVTVSVTAAPTATPPSGGGGNGPVFGSVGGHRQDISNLLSTTTNFAYLQNQIIQLTAQLNSLLSQAKNTVYTPYNFTRDLYYRMVGNDVLHLQQYLNTHGFVVSTTDAGSPGNETTKFGLLTYKALVKFQKSVGLPATGFFGPMTRAYISNH